MKVENSGTERIGRQRTNETSPAKKTRETKEQRDASLERSLDRAALSEDAITLAEARKKLGELPETREALVAELKAKIEAGEYEVSFEDLADRLLSLFGDE